MTPRQSDVPTKVVGGLFFVAFIGLFMLFACGYHTLVLILIGMMCVIGAFTFTYARRATLEGLSLVAGVGILSLIVQGYHTLVFVIAGTIFVSGALAFIDYDGPHVWSWWFPDQPLNQTIKRWLRYLLQAVTVAFAYGQAHFYINVLRGVDPGSFPTALTALTLLNTLMGWLLVLSFVALVTAVLYGGKAYIAGLRGD